MDSLPINKGQHVKKAKKKQVKVFSFNRIMLNDTIKDFSDWIEVFIIYYYSLTMFYPNILWLHVRLPSDFHFCIKA